MVGAESEEDFDHAKIALDPMGKNMIYCGGPGTGTAAKISHNLVLGIQMIATSEGLAMGEKLGIDPKKLTEILQVSTANSNGPMNIFNPRPGNVETAPASNGYKGGYSVSLTKKDLGIAIESAADVNQMAEMG